MSAHVTINTLAKLAGTSPATVSIVLNNRPLAQRLAPRTKERILELAERLHYRPSHLACSLRKGRSQLLGLVIGDICDPYFSQFTSRCLNYVEECGYQLLISLTSWDEEKEKKCLMTLLDHGVDGIFYPPFFRRNPKFQQLVLQYGIPVLLMDQRIEGFPSINLQMVPAFQKMAAAFASLGCHHLTTIESNNELTNRQLVEICSQHGIETSYVHADSIAAYTTILLERRNQFLYLPNCWQARHLLKQARQKRLNYHPYYTTFYTFPQDRITKDPPIGIFHYDFQSRIHQTVDFLIDLIENKQKYASGETSERTLEIQFDTPDCFP